MASITRNDRGQTDAALVRRFRQAVTRRDRAATFDRVVREHRDAILGRCAERCWPDADAALAAARGVFIVAYLAMADPAKLARPDRLRDWLLGIAAHGELESAMPAVIDAFDWPALDADIADGGPDAPHSAARRASLRGWLEQIVATLPEGRQQLYDLFVRRALSSRNAAMELGIDGPEARRLRCENRAAILRAFEVTALAAAQAALDSLDGETLGCGELRQLLADAQRDGDMPERVQLDSLVLPTDLRLAATSHAGECDACRHWRDDCAAQWAPELLAILAGDELNEQIIRDLQTLPEYARSHRVGSAAGHFRGGHRDGVAAGAGRAVIARGPAAVLAGAGVLLLLLLLGFVQPGFFLSPSASGAPGSSSPSKDPGSDGPNGSDDSQVTGTSSATPGHPKGRPGPSATASSPGGLPPGTGSAAPTQPGQGTVPPSASPTSSTARPTSSPSFTFSPLPPTPSRSSPAPSPVTSTPSPSSPAPTTPPPTPTPTPTPTTSAAPTAPSSTPAPS